MKNNVWDAIKISPVNTSLIFSLKNRSFFNRKLSGVAIKYILKNTYNKLIINPRYFENTYAMNQLMALLSPGDRVLDIGSAESELPLYLHACEFNITAFDQRPYPFSEFVQGDAMKLDQYFENTKFDALTVISTIEHIGLGAYGDPVAETSYLGLIQNWRRVLRNDGYLIITLPVTSGDTRREKGQWVINCKDFQETVKKSGGIVVHEKLIVEDDSIPQGWSSVSPETDKSYDLGIYLTTLQYSKNEN